MCSVLKIDLGLLLVVTDWLHLVLVEGLEAPPLPGLLLVALLHHELVLLAVDGQTPPAGAVPQCVRLVLVLPVLVTCNKKYFSTVKIFTPDIAQFVGPSLISHFHKSKWKL